MQNMIYNIFWLHRSLTLQNRNFAILGIFHIYPFLSDFHESSVKFVIFYTMDKCIYNHVNPVKERRRKNHFHKETSFFLNLYPDIVEC